MQRLKKWNTLRNQMLIVYVIVMLIVLIIVSVLTIRQTSSMISNNAEEQIQQTAVEASGRFDSLFDQLNLITKQVLSNETLQEILLNEKKGNAATFQDKQDLIGITNRLQANADGIYTTELFNLQLEKIIPLDGAGLKEQMNQDMLQTVSEAKGRLIWLGEDPNDSNYYLLMRRVNLLNDQFNHGGYLMIRVMKNYFQFKDQANQKDNIMILTDQNDQKITSTHANQDIQTVLAQEQDEIVIDEMQYIKIETTSNTTGWTVTLLTPVSKLTEGMAGLRSGMIVSGLVGFIIFSIFSYFLSTVITKPIHKLTVTMQKASEGKLTFSPQSITANEINELNNTYNQLVKETNYLIQMVYEKELIKSKTELKALQAQINPHFLFNTLDSLYWSLEEKEEEELSELVIAMSELFRYTITHYNHDEWVTIGEELAHIDRYMLIMKMRFGDRLSCTYDISAQLKQVPIPKLMIQPLVENAVLHGIGNQSTRGKVEVTIRKVKASERLQIIVADDGVGMSEEKVAWLYQSMKEKRPASQKGTGIAIANVNKRLHLYYHKEEIRGLMIQSELGEGTQIAFEIPIIKG